MTSFTASLQRPGGPPKRLRHAKRNFLKNKFPQLQCEKGITIPAKTLSKEYFTYYIILDILLSSIISPDCSTSRRRLGGFSPAHARCGRFGAGSRTSARPTHRAAAGTSRASLATRPIVRPALPPCPPHCCSLPHMRRSCSSASRGASNTSLSVVAAWSAVQQLEVRRDNTINTLWRP